MKKTKRELEQAVVRAAVRHYAAYQYKSYVATEARLLNAVGRYLRATKKPGGKR